MARITQTSVFDFGTKIDRLENGSDTEREKK